MPAHLPFLQYINLPASFLLLHYLETGTTPDLNISLPDLNCPVPILTPRQQTLIDNAQVIHLEHFEHIL